MITALLLTVALAQAPLEIQPSAGDPPTLAYVSLESELRASGITKIDRRNDGGIIIPTTCYATRANWEFASKARGAEKLGDKILCPHKDFPSDEIAGWYQILPPGYAIMLFTWAHKDGKVGWVRVPISSCKTGANCAY